MYLRNGYITLKYVPHFKWLFTLRCRINGELAKVKVDPFCPRIKPDQCGAAARKSTKQLLTAEHAAGSSKINVAPGEPEGPAAPAMTR